MKVAEVMIRRFYPIRPEASLSEAAGLFQNGSGKGEGGLPSLLVMDGDRLVGILTLTDLLKAVIPAYLAQDPHLAHLAWNGLLEKQIQKIRDRSVSDFMTKKVITIKADAPLSEAADLLLINRIHSLPVTREGSVVGMFYLSDLASQVFRFLSKGKN